MEPSLPAITHVIFDVDGLLLNTESLYTQTTERVVGQFGKQFTWELKLQQMGKKGSEAAADIVRSLDLPLTPEEYLEQSGRIWQQLFPTTELMPGAERLVRHLHRHGVPMALASGGGAPAFKLKTSRHGALFALFTHAVLASTEPEVTNGKPAPDVYQNVLTFEDAPNGVLSARAAGMPCIMVPDPRMPEEMTRPATLVLTSLEHFRPEDFGLPPFEA
ncbi:pseudouridine-5'-phosphatase-like [Pollicipes pollicipes]|uniref:pseudouridine-5'-phosphatase-like n=1 Tax=Pollicipes pollicipes TaxID=41117 RepID=UPI0018859DE6|nr:pseudouridine-5'-phosphatase-like [Pollicipes pollicipes]